MKKQVLKPLILLLVLYSNFSIAAELKILSGNRVARYSQGLLNAHIRGKLKNPQSPKNLNYCFVKVKEALGSSLELYSKPCLESWSHEDLSQFRQKNKPSQILELGPVVPTRATEEWNFLKQKYAAQLSKINPADIQSLDAEVIKDSLGHLLFLRLNGKKVNVGYIDHEDRLMDLCSASWSEICYFDGQKFVLGQEIVEVDYGETTVISDWLRPRTYIDFEDVLASTVYTRGNDDSRDQAIYYLKIPKKNIKVPVTEEWYLYFLLNPKTSHLVEKAIDNNGKQITSHRTRREWNYLTAIHPLQLFKTKNRQTGEKSLRLYMGAAVVYDASLEIEDADCDLSETEGFNILPARALVGLKPQLPGEFLTPFERGLLVGDIAEAIDERLGSLVKADEARFIGRKNYSTGANNPNPQTKYLPPIMAIPGLNIFGMTANISLPLDYSKGSYVIFKENYASEQLAPYDVESYEGAFVYSQANHHMIKEYIKIYQLPSGAFKIDLVGFNPNEYIANNPSQIQLEDNEPDLVASFDPAAVYKVWDLEGEDILPAHTSSRALSSKIQKMKFHLNSAYYESVTSPGSQQRKDLVVLAKALEAQETISEEERDWFVGKMDTQTRFVGKNVGQSFGVPGRFNHRANLGGIAMGFLPEMLSPEWKFPRYFLVEKFQESTQQEDDSGGSMVYSTIEIKPEIFQQLLKFVKDNQGNFGEYPLALNDHKVIIENLLTDPLFLSHQLEDSLKLAYLGGDLFGKNYNFGQYFYAFSGMMPLMKRFKLASRDQIRAMGRKPEESLKPYLVYVGRNLERIDFKKIILDDNQCFLSAGDNIEKLKSCAERSNKIQSDFLTMMELVDVPRPQN